MHTPLAMGVCSMLLGFTLGSVQPMVMSLLHQLAPEHRYGEAVAMRVIKNPGIGLCAILNLGRQLSRKDQDRPFAQVRCDQRRQEPHGGGGDAEAPRMLPITEAAKPRS